MNLADPLTGGGTRKPIKGSLAPNANLPLCKLCLHSIQQGQARVWLRRPMGLSHVECVKDRNDVESVS